MQKRSCTLLALAILLLSTFSAARGQDRREPGLRRFTFSFRVPPERPINIKGPTLGGKQFWSDELIHGDWRIQHNVVTNHYRVLDHNNVRRAWGSSKYCYSTFDELRAKERIAPVRGRVVLVLHGLCRPRSVMQPLCDHLKDNGYTVLNVSYASTRLPIEEHAKTLARIIGHLKHVSEINFVAHSMGNLVVRHYLGDQTNTKKGLRPDPRIKRFVMLGPPNNGATLAKTFKDNAIVKLVWGSSGDQLAEWKSLQERLAVPACQFGIVAGGRGKNPLIPGSDDMFVSVEETRLAGARDFRVAHVLHSQMAKSKTVHNYVATFLKQGHFSSPAERKPIPAKSAPDRGPR